MGGIVVYRLAGGKKEEVHASRQRDWYRKYQWPAKPKLIKSLRLLQSETSTGDEMMRNMKSKKASKKASVKKVSPETSVDTTSTVEKNSSSTVVVAAEKQVLPMKKSAKSLSALSCVIS